MEILGGHPVEPPHPAFQAAVVGVDILHMPYAVAAMSVVGCHETPRLDAEVLGDDGVARLAVRAEHGIRAQGGAEDRRHGRGAGVPEHPVGGGAGTPLHRDQHPFAVRPVRRQLAPLPLVGSREEGFVRLDDARHSLRPLPRQELQEPVPPAKGAVHGQLDRACRAADGLAAAHAPGVGKQLALVAQAQEGRPGQRGECLPAGIAAHPLLPPDAAKPDAPRVGAVRAGRRIAQPLDGQAGSVGVFDQDVDPA